MRHLPESAGSPISRMPRKTEGGLCQHTSPLILDSFLLAKLPCFDFSNPFKTQKIEETLCELADWIANQVLRPIHVEPDTDFAVRVLREAVESISLSVKHLKSKDLEKIFGGKIQPGAQLGSELTLRKL